MILFRHRVPVTRGHRAAIDGTVDLLLPGHPGRLLFLWRRLRLFRSRVFSSLVFRSLVFRSLVFRGLIFGALFSGALASGAAVDAAAGAVPPLGAPCASAAPAGSNTSAAADAATARRDSFCIENSSSAGSAPADPITSAAVRTPGFWRGGRAWTGFAWPGCRS